MYLQNYFLVPRKFKGKCKKCKNGTDFLGFFNYS